MTNQRGQCGRCGEVDGHNEGCLEWPKCGDAHDERNMLRQCDWMSEMGRDDIMTMGECRCCDRPQLQAKADLCDALAEVNRQPGGYCHMGCVVERTDDRERVK